ncbi:MAG: S-layer homology domain-containing protein [Oscillospiraceae bacterium]|nr:S-layer homology domain-containing protein [Oscillospiraceae bacterium]
MAAQPLNAPIENKSNEVFWYYITNGKATINGLTTTNTDIKIPRYIEDDGVKYSVTEIIFERASLTSLDVSASLDLERIDCMANELTALDVRNCKSLKTLLCSTNLLKTLNVNGATKLTTLYCYSNLLTTLDMRNTNLNSPDAVIYCNKNFIGSLDDIIGLTDVTGMFTNFRLTYYDQLDSKYLPLRRFTDVGWDYIFGGSDKWYVNELLFALDRHLFAGVSETKFAPDASMTRAMLVTVMQRYAAAPNVAADNRFSDVAADAWYANAVAWAAKNNIVAGVSPTEFAPNANVTREQFATILYRYAKGYLKIDVSKTQPLSKFVDVLDVSAYATDAVKWCVANGIIKGKWDDNFDDIIDPLGNATRAEVATMIHRFDEVLNP